jgi:hypothetical protein
MPETAVARFLLKWMLVPVLLLWAYHLAQRRYAETVGEKRAATLYLTLLLLVAWVVIYAFVRLGLGDVFLLVPAAAVITVAVWQRRKLFPYQTRCAACGRLLGIERILFRGDNTCRMCAPDRGDGGAPRPDDKENTP